MTTNIINPTQSTRKILLAGKGNGPLLAAAANDRNANDDKKRNRTIIIIAAVGFLILCLCCLLLVITFFLLPAEMSPTTIETTDSIVVEQEVGVLPAATATSVPADMPIPTATASPVPLPTEPVDVCAAYSGSDLFHFAIASGNLQCLTPFLSDPGVIVAPSGVGLHSETVSEFTHAPSSIISWLADGFGHSSPTCYGYRRFDIGQVTLVFTDYELNWAVMLGDYPSDFAAVNFVLDPASHMPEGYVLSMIVGEWTESLPYLPVDPCPSLAR